MGQVQSTYSPSGLPYKPKIGNPLKNNANSIVLGFSAKKGSEHAMRASPAIIQEKISYQK